MIYCVWYPSGGFGHFVNAVLTIYGKNFVRPLNSLEFSNNGNSHKLDLVVPKYLHGHWPGGIEFSIDKNYCVLIDNGIDNENDNFRSLFPSASVIKICYSDYTWPIVARTMIDKAMESSIEQQLPVDIWNTNEPWAKREKYFLFLRDHDFRFKWRPISDRAIYIDELIKSYSSCFDSFDSFLEISNFNDSWDQWRSANAKYIDPIATADLIISCVNSKVAMDLGHINDIWSQAVVYYYIWLNFDIEVPHNDYSNWFTNTNDIVKMLTDHGVTV
jgi:hypothetical protein